MAHLASKYVISKLFSRWHSCSFLSQSFTSSATINRRAGPFFRAKSPPPAGGGSRSWWAWQRWRSGWRSTDAGCATGSRDYVVSACATTPPAAGSKNWEYTFKRVKHVATVVRLTALVYFSEINEIETEQINSNEKFQNIIAWAMCHK